MPRKKLSSLINLIEDVSNDSPVEKQFITDLKYSIEKDATKDVHSPSRTFKPSSIGGCERNIYYQLMGVPTAPSTATSNNVGILENGTDRHIRIQEAICAMKDNGIDCEYVDISDFVAMRGLDYIEIKDKSGIETKCYWAELPLSFLTDGIVKYKGKYYILEIKTMNSKKFFESKESRPEHHAQGICYSLAFKLDDVMYLYENRDTLDKKAFIYHITDDMRQELLDKVNYVKEAVRQEIPPVPNAKHNCKWCAYYDTCELSGV